MAKKKAAASEDGGEKKTRKPGEGCTTQREGEGPVEMREVDGVLVNVASAEFIAANHPAHLHGK